MKKPLIIIAGPTACGKTEASVKLAKMINGEIVSADSMQVYKYMDIGTAKATPAEMDGIKHYMIDELLPDEEFNVMVFQSRAKKYIEEIYSKGKVPIIVGGTGFYINAVVYDNDFTETDGDNSVRVNLYENAEKYGAEYNYNILKEIDPEYAKNIHANNIKRVARAIEYYRLTGQRFSEHNSAQKAKKSPYNVCFAVLTMDRERLYERINKRVDIMVEAGLVKEVKELIDRGYSPSLVSMQGLGYKEIVPAILGEVSLDTAVEELKKRTRHFAKRQLTWFKGQTDNPLWIDITDKNTDYASEKIKEYYEQMSLETK